MRVCASRVCQHCRGNQHYSSHFHYLRFAMCAKRFNRHCMRQPALLNYWYYRGTSAVSEIRCFDTICIESSVYRNSRYDVQRPTSHHPVASSSSSWNYYMRPPPTHHSVKVRYIETLETMSSTTPHTIPSRLRPLPGTTTRDHPLRDLKTDIERESSSTRYNWSPVLY